MEIRRHKDILAVKAAGCPAVALHASALEVAELSDTAWETLTPITWADGRVVASRESSEALRELEEWNDQPASPDATSNAFGIRSLTINVTQICNLHCTYCAAGGDGTYGDPIKKISIERTLPQIRFFLDQVPAGEHFHIAFLGGEPLLYPDAVRAIGEYTMAEAVRRGVSASFKVTTNGTVVTSSALDALTALKAGVVVSIDGPEAVNDRQRKQKNGTGAYALAMEGLQRLLERKADLGPLGVHAVFNEENLEVESTWEHFANLPVDFMEFTFSVTHSANEAEATRVYNEALARVAHRAFSLGGEAGLRKIRNFDDLFRRLDSQKRLLNHCGLGKSLVVIDARNTLYNCPWIVGSSEGRLGQGTDLDYDRFGRHERSLIEANDCGSCWARFLCGGGCSFVHGRVDGAPMTKKLAFCERTRFLTALTLMYYQRSRSPQLQNGEEL